MTSATPKMRKIRSHWQLMMNFIQRVTGCQLRACNRCFSILAFPPRTLTGVSIFLSLTCHRPQVRLSFISAKQHGRSEQKRLVDIQGDRRTNEWFEQEIEQLALLH